MTEKTDKDDFDAQFARILKVTNSASDAELARKLGISPPSVAGAKQRRSIPLAWLKTIGSVYGVSLDWLVRGMDDPHGVPGSMVRTRQRRIRAIAEEMPGQADYLRERLRQEGLSLGLEEAASPPVPQPSEQARPAKETPLQTDVDMIFIPLVDACLSAGSGSLQTSAESERHYAFRADFLHRKGNPETMVLMRVSGDSMEPEIKSGDVVLLDQGKTNILPGRMYAVGIEDAIYIKQLDTLPGKLVLKSMNPAYPHMEIDMNEDLAEQARILGQILWVGREYRY